MLGPQPTATYRFQLTPTFGFADVVAQLPRLQELGVSHVYLSPVTEAVPGSTHGYDVVDHGAVRAELGGADGLMAVLDGCATRGMGVVVDHVPNHMAVGQPALNRMWWAMLRDGPGSDAARWFDVDWAAGGGKVILPVLGEPLDAVVPRLEVADGELRLGDQRWPLAAGTETLSPADALAGQHYRLQHWRDPARNVRRFFTIDDLVAVRVEDPLVAAVVDTVPRLLAGHQAFAGVRVDHVDGLADPLAYLTALRAAIGDRWLLVEKILASGETLPKAWPVDGTTGYEHAAVVEHALLDRGGWDRLRDGWAAITGDARPFREWELAARREVLDAGLRPDLERVARVAGGAPGVVEAVAELSVHLERYRTYLPDEEGRPALHAAVDEAVATRPDLKESIESFVAMVDDSPECRTRWQQLTGPATAKGVEDRAFWRYAPLGALAEVGGHPEPIDDPVPTLHAHHESTQARWPATLLAGTTHDTKRGEDVRATGLALATEADRFLAVVEAWLAGPGAAISVDAATHWQALQTALTTPGLDGERFAAFLVKAAREASVQTSWTDPDEAFEAQLPLLAAAILGWDPVQELARAIASPGRTTAIAMLAVRLTAPGVPDLYQGTEAFRYVLVDPDNRADPDHDALDALVSRAATVDGRSAWAEDDALAARAVLISRVLGLRRDLRLEGYLPLDVGSDLVGFARMDAAGEPAVVTIVPRAVRRAEGATVSLPPGRWRHVLLDGEAEATGTIALDDLLAAFPAIVLTRA